MQTPTHPVKDRDNCATPHNFPHHISQLRLSSTEVDEVGYLAYGDRHADLLFEVVSRRYEDKSLLLTTNRPFSEWSQVFPNAACVVSLIDRIIHHAEILAEILAIDGESYRAREARERAEQRAAQKKKGRRP